MAGADAGAQADVVALGATPVRFHERTWGPFAENHSVVRDPEGDEFCIQ